MLQSIIEFITEVVFDTFCGWIGHHFVKLVTLGRVDLDWGNGSESVIAQWTGVFVLVGLILVIATLMS